MREGIHPEAYRFVVFKDMSNNTSFLGKSTANTKETMNLVITSQNEEKSIYMEAKLHDQDCMENLPRKAIPTSWSKT